MLERILEPEAMDSDADAREYDAMDFAEVNRAFAEDALQVAPTAGTVLDVGTGTARIPILMARLAPCLNLVAIDLSLSMLRLARQHVQAAGLENRIILRSANARRLTADQGQYDMVVSNSIVHHIPEPLEVFAAIAAVLAPGAALFIRDLHRPETELEWQGLVAEHAAGCNGHQRRLFADSLLASLSVQEVRELAAAAGLRDVEVAKTSDRHWTMQRPAVR